MSGLTPAEHEHKEMPGFSLTKALEEVSQQGYAKMAALQEKLLQLSSLQSILRETQKSKENAKLELRAVVWQALAQEEDLNQRLGHSQALWARCLSTHSSNVALQLCVRKEGEEAGTARAGYNEYRNKMEGHGAALALAESQRESHKVLEEKRRLVRLLNQTKEHLQHVVENHSGRAMQEAKTRKEKLKMQMNALSNTVATQREELLKELDTQAHMKKDMEIQKRRYEAIVKRLHSQLNQAQANHRHLSRDIQRMETQVSELRSSP